MLFIILLAFAAAALACAAEFFSIYGLSQIYAASSFYVILMGISLGFAKIMATSFLYRFWSKAKWPLKTYMVLGVVVFMTITSAGVFGFLTAGYQKGNIPTVEIASKLESDKTQLQRYIDRKAEIDKQIGAVSNNAVRSKRQLMQSFNDEYKTLQPKIDSLTTEINELQTRQVNVEAKIGPIIYAAKVLGLNPDDALFYLTLLIVVVFDPMAVALTIATNMAIEDRRKTKEAKESVLPPKPPVEPVVEAVVEPEPTPEPEPEVILPTEPEVTPIPSKTLSQREVILERMRKEIAENSPD